MIFMTSAIILALLTIWLMPKRITLKEIYLTWAVLWAFEATIDGVLAGVFKLYYFGNSMQIELFDMIQEVILPPSAGIIMLNFMPEKNSKFIIYMMLMDILAVCFEWLSVQFGYLHYIRWSLWYSIPFYLLGIGFLRWHIRYLRDTM